MARGCLGYPVCYSDFKEDNVFCTVAQRTLSMNIEVTFLFSQEIKKQLLSERVSMVTLVVSNIRANSVDSYYTYRYVCNSP